MRSCGVLRFVAPLCVITSLGLFFYALTRLVFFVLRQPWIYEGTIRRLAAQAAPPDSVVFVGSSTIRLWDTLARDFAPVAVVNRGFVGAVVSQVNAFAARLLPPSLVPRAIVFYCGGNDLAWGVSVDDVVTGVERFVGLAHELAPSAVVYVLSVALTPTRRRTWKRVRAVNERLAAVCTAAGVHFVDVASPMLDERGRPRRALFLFDGIHPSAAGYAAWTSVLKPRFAADLA